MAADLLRLSLSPHFTTSGHRKLALRPHFHSPSPLPRRLRVLLPPAGAIRRSRGLIAAKAVDIGAPAGISSESEEKPANSSFLLDVNGMMCGACVSRVKGILSADERVESAVVNMLTETAAVRLKPEAAGGGSVAEDLAKRLSTCGFDAKPRVNGRGSWDVLHNSYVKGALALGALLGPGRDLLQDGLRAFVKGSPNMNSLVGFGSVAAFILSAVRPFLDKSVLQSLVCTHARLVITPSEMDSSAHAVLSSDAICIEVPTDDIRVGDNVLVLPGETIPVDDGPLKIAATSTGSNSTISKIIRMVEDAQSNEAPIQRLADSIAGPFVYSVMTLSLATLVFWSSIGAKVFPDVLLNEIAGPEGNPLVLGLKLAVDVLVVSCPCALGLATPTAILVGTSLGARQGLLLRGGDVLERLASIDFMAFDKTGTLTEGKPTVSAIASLAYDSSEILQLAAAVEKTTSHPLAKAILSKAESCGLHIPATRGQITEPGFGSLAEVDGRLVAVGALEWVSERFETKKRRSDITDLMQALRHESAKQTSSLDKSETTVYVGREGEGIIGAIAISDTLRHDAEFAIARLKELGIQTALLSGDREEAVASIGKIVGIESELVQASLSPRRKSQFISDIQASGCRIAMVGDGINDAPSLALADVGIALRTEAQETAASDAASIVLLGNRLSQVVDAVDLARATMSKVHQNLLWAVAYNVVAIPIAAGLLLPQFDFAMTPSLSGGLMALSSIFVVTNSLLLQLHGSNQEKKEQESEANVSLTSKF
ncbi:hypothetical protein Cgig2_011402 [Carnegiea gigantea]|uniref:HMA domain-containing protein n=1 Tax=Carnegiea gigantea TaxID=171969 RepID=A0A9Q1KQ66_9CARY|nr:hypothetical protein Cgig2_011402 [Carnegiea gigantea]